MHAFASKADRRAARASLLRRLAVLALLLVVATLLDPLVFRFFAERVEVEGESVLRADRSAEGNDWYRLIRVTGSFWFWLAAAGAFLFYDLRDTSRRTPSGSHAPVARAGYLVAAVAAAGLLAELAKLIVGRERPVTGLDYQGFVFAGPFAGFSGAGNLGFPSSHAAAAFGGAAAVGLLIPSLRPIMIALATACAFSRVLVGAHWLSDVVGGAAIGLAAAYWLYPRMNPFPPAPGQSPIRARQTA